MGGTSDRVSRGTQQLSQGVSARSNASGAATFTFQSPPPNLIWTGTISIPNAPSGAVFTASVGATNWGAWGGETVFGPIQCRGLDQLTIVATGLTANTTYEAFWIGSSDEQGTVQPVWPDANSTALTAQISGTVGVTGSLTSVGSITNPVTTLPGTTLTTGTGTGASTSITVASTATFPSSGFLSVATSSGVLTFAYTGTTATSFTGLTLEAGVSSWAWTSGQPVNLAQTVTGSVFSNNLSSQAVVTTGTGWASSSIWSGTLTQPFRSFSLIATTGTLAATTYVLTNTTTGQSVTRYSGGFSEIDLTLGGSAGDSFTLTPSGTSSSVAWALIGYRDQIVQAIGPPAGGSIDTVTYGGGINYTPVTATLAVGASQTLVASLNSGQSLRLQHFFAWNSSKATVAGAVLLQSQANLLGTLFTYPIAGLNLTATTQYVTANYNFSGQIVPGPGGGTQGILTPSGSLVSTGALIVTNNTTAVIQYFVGYDVITNPTIY